MGGFYKLSEGDVIRGIAGSYVAARGTTFPAAYASSFVNKLQQLSEEDLYRGWLVGACSAGCDATTIYAAAVAAGMRKVSDGDLIRIILSNVSVGASAATVETNSKAGNGISDRGILEIITTLAAPTFNSQAMETAAWRTNKYGKLNRRKILECLAWVTCSGSSCDAQSQVNNSVPSAGGGGGGAPTGFTFAIYQETLGIASGWTRATWTAPPAGTISTELWTSTDNVTFVLTSTVAAAGNSVFIVSGSSPFYGKIRFVSASGNGPFSSVLSINYGADWSNRVVANGGVAPGATFVTAVNRWCDSLARIDLLRRIYSAITTTDALISSFTPMVGNFGFALWANNGWLIGNLSINGLQGSGPFLDTGIVPTDIQLAQDPLGNAYPLLTESFGLDFYDTLSTNSATCEIGAHSNTPLLAVYYFAQFSGTTYFSDPDDGTGGQTNYGTVIGERLGMGNRIANNVAEMYDYAGGVFTVRATNAASVAGHPVVGVSFYAWASNRFGGNLASDKRGSYVCLRQGWSRANAQLYAPIVRQLRTDIGGGNS